MAEPTTPSLDDVISHAIETGDTSGTTGEDSNPPHPDASDDVDASGEGSTGADLEASGDAEPDAAGGEPDAGEGEQPSGDGEGTDEDGKQPERDPTTGKFKKPEDKKPDDKSSDPNAAKKADALNDPIPTDLKKETQDRIRALVKTAKEETASREQIQQNFDYMVNGVKATGTTPEQYGEVLSFLALFNSRDAKSQEKALELVEGVAERLATLLGKERSVGDPLKGHEDLREAVAKGHVTPQYAKEIARTRNQGNFRTEIETAQSAQITAEQQKQQAITQARSELNTLEGSLQATDPEYAAKKAALVPILQPLFKTIPASQWKVAFEQAYSRMSVPLATAASKQKVPARQPLRAGASAGRGAGGSNGGGMKSTEGSMLDAVNAALDSMK